MSFNTDKLVQGGDYDYITRTSLNQGILRTTGFVNKENINPAGTWSLGLLRMDFFYRRKPWYAGQFVRKITPKIEIKDSAILFFSTLLNKQKPKLLSVLVRDVNKVFCSVKIQLPTKDGEIDFNFMEAFIAELEAQRVAELEAQRVAELSAYLTVSGYDNYELSDEELDALRGFNDLDDGSWGTYKVGDLFKVNSYTKRFDANKVVVKEDGQYPYIVRTSLNNGQKGYIDEDERFLSDGNTIAFGQDTATMFYQEKPYFTGDKIKVLRPKNNCFNKNNAQFFLAAMRKPFSSFSWGASRFSVTVIENQKVLLPTKDGEIDFDFMEALISAVKKLVIKDVVLYSERKIAATKEAVSKNEA